MFNKSLYLAGWMSMTSFWQRN